MSGVDRQRLKEIFAAALEREERERDAFVARACAGDPELLLEVRRLVEAHERTGDFMAEPAVVPLLAEDPLPSFEPEQVLVDRFRIVRFIASGGMGEVYEAEDLLLGERVALKTVRQRGGGPDGLDRLKREIQSARRVTHPNVCRTYDVAEQDDPPLTLFTMELLEGPTLSQRLRENGPFTRKEALPLIRQIAAGLQAAHDAGVIHRDFKSGNVILAGGPACWRPVITDFGLALPADAEGKAPPVRGGTPGYMAPEQLEGGPVTSAVDVYALGVVIARMIGAQASSGVQATPREPGSSPGLADDRRLLGPWRRIVDRCLEREPARRYQRPADVARALNAASGASRRKPLLNALAWALLAITAGAGTWLYLSTRHGTVGRGGDTAPAGMVRRQIPLRQNDQPWQLSPDGRSIILTEMYSDGRPGDLILFDVLSHRRQVVLHTPGPAGEALPTPMYAVFSPAGDRVAYMMQSGDARYHIRTIRIDGADDRLLYSNPHTRPKPLDWSPDGKRILARLDRDGSSRISILSADDGTVIRELEMRESAIGKIIFNLDGRKVVYEVWRSAPEPNWDIRLLDPETGVISPLVRDPANHNLVGWTRDGRQLIFMSDRSGPRSIWGIPFSEEGTAGGPRELALDVGPMVPISCRGGGSLLYSVARSRIYVYTAEIDVDAGRTVSAPRPVEWSLGGSIFYPSWSTDGSRLAFLSKIWENTGVSVIGLLSKETGKTTRAAFPGFLLERPQWLGDSGSLVALGTDARGRSGLHRLNPATGEAGLVINRRTLGSVFEGIWSRDGRFHFNRYSDFRKGMFRLDTQAGERQILYIPRTGENLGRENLALSPDERTLAFQVFSLGAKTSTLMLMPAAGGSARPLWTVQQPHMFWLGAFAWSRDGRNVLAVRTREGKSEIWRVPVDGGAPVKIDFPETTMMFVLRMNPDGKTVAYRAGSGERTEVWILDNLMASFESVR